ncbi:MAG: hypothetical protein IBJ07_06495 [Rhizobiaceae bacterium]|nr:hypothetical protein [Rhizobiaceae bacterium]
MKTLVPEPVAPAAAAGRRSAPYAGQNAVLATMHGEEEAIALVLCAPARTDRLHASDIDANAPGTFTGEIPRDGTVRDAAIAMARLDMEVDLPIGLANEGSYGPHPQSPSFSEGSN